MEVHHLNDDHADHRPENLATLCAFCHSVFHLGLAGIQHRGVIAYLPCIPQAALNHLARTLFVAMMGDDIELAERAKIDHDAMLATRSTVDSILGAGMSDPARLGALLLTLDERQFEAAHPLFAPDYGLRLLPTPQGYEKQLKAWCESAYEAIPPSSWARLALSYTR